MTIIGLRTAAETVMPKSSRSLLIALFGQLKLGNAEIDTRSMGTVTFGEPHQSTCNLLRKSPVGRSTEEMISSLLFLFALALTFPRLSISVENEACVCGPKTVTQLGQTCFLQVEERTPVGVQGCACVDSKEALFVAAFSDSAAVPHTVSCRLEQTTTIDPLEDELLNITTTELPTTVEELDVDDNDTPPKRPPEQKTTPSPSEQKTTQKSEKATEETPKKPADEVTEKPSGQRTPEPEAKVDDEKVPTKASTKPVDPLGRTPAPDGNGMEKDPETGEIIVGGGGVLGNDKNIEDDNEGNSTEEEEVIEESPHRCNNSEILQGDTRRTAKGLLYFTTAWIVIWCLITMICNLCWENGHHRYVNFVQELAIMLLFIVIGTCSLQSFKEKISCQITSHLIAATVAWLMASFFMEGISANRIVKGRTRRIGWCETVLNTVIPFIVAGVVVGAGVGVVPNVYGHANIHCFCSLQTKQFWIFVIPPWMFIVLFSFVNQNTIVSCDLSRNEAHEPHLYWGRKSAKSNTVLPLLIFSAYASAMFGADLQFLWLFVVYTILCVVLGPLIFLLHTYCYLKSSKRLGCSPIYAQCRIRYLCNLPEHQEFSPGNTDDSSTTDDKPSSEEEPQEKPKPKKEPQEKAPFVQEEESPRWPPPVDDTPTRSSPYIASRPPSSSNPRQPHTSQNLYDWLSDRNEANMRQGEDILFRPRVYD
uniref:G_PROTEIN_RECEP_F2_4 domain-containing protein n=1 Tax=Steinernema glaseri TaxID=37863 RepID=A0A1I7YU26_9BILA